MKIRLGFVSNSSSSSFCIYGAYVSIKDILDIDDNEDANTGENEEEEICDCDYDEAISKVLKGTGLIFEFSGDYDSNEVCVGRYYTSLKNDETGKQFREDVKNKLEKIVGHKVKCDHHEEVI